MNREQILQGFLDALIDSAEIDRDLFGEDITITSHVMQGDISVYYHSSDIETYIEVENTEYPEREYINVTELLTERTERDDMLEELNVRTREWFEDMDEWERHGFRDERDYYNYRYK